MTEMLLWASAWKTGRPFPTPCHCCRQHGLLPMKALGMVIFSHMRSRTSRPDSGEAMALTMVAMSLWMDR